MANPSVSKISALSVIPSVDQILRTPAALGLRDYVGSRQLTALARGVVEELRTQIRSNDGRDYTKESLLETAVKRLQEACQDQARASLRRVINATGVILHTNLGRAPLSASARAAVAEAAGYCTLEYDSTAGSRGKRAAYAEELLTQLTGAEAALVVNNCASAALLVLTVLARGGETLVSRGELVEIGGDFRVPDVMSNSGTRMVEVGTTNRTKLEDYRRAVTDETRLIMRVHPSNYRIIGFVTAPELSELAALAHERGLWLYEDAGSGVLVDLSRYGLGDEPLVSESIAAGADVVSFSGDKLLGASQAGLIVGRGEIIERLRKHSLYRALRADKLCLAALETTLESLRLGKLDDVPVLHMLSISKDVLEQRARSLQEQLRSGSIAGLTVTLVPGESAVGGGSGPSVHPETVLLALEHETLSSDEMERQLRLSSPPIIARISDHRVLLDLRTVAPGEEAELLKAIQSLST